MGASLRVHHRNVVSHERPYVVHRSVRSDRSAYPLKGKDELAKDHLVAEIKEAARCRVVDIHSVEFLYPRIQPFHSHKYSARRMIGVSIGCVASSANVIKGYAKDFWVTETKYLYKKKSKRLRAIKEQMIAI